MGSSIRRRNFNCRAFIPLRSFYRLTHFNQFIEWARKNHNQKSNNIFYHLHKFDVVQCIHSCHCKKQANYAEMSCSETFDVFIAVTVLLSFRIWPCVVDCLDCVVGCILQQSDASFTCESLPMLVIVIII